MKKAAFIFILSLSVLGSGAQHRTERFRPVYSVHTPKLGIVGGPQFSNFHDEAVGSPNALFGFHFGLAYSMPVSKRISFEPQLVYSKKGLPGSPDSPLNSFIPSVNWQRSSS